MPVPGNWTLYYDWNSTGAYGNTPMTINADGQWSNGQGYTGEWVQVAGVLTFQFSNSKTTYAGNIADKSVTGINTTFGGLNGSFYMLESGAAAAAAAAKAHKVADTSGKPKRAFERTRRRFPRTAILGNRRSAALASALAGTRVRGMPT